MTAVEALFKKDGVIIMLAACNDGHLINHLLKTIGNL